jgi:hypothetical protein
MDKNKLLDDMGRPLTQGLFLEIDYNEKYAIYTLKNRDHEYKGVMYPSLKRLYLEMCDPTEYLFANKYLLDWDQWQRICENVILRKHVDAWRAELDIKMRAEGVREMISLARSENGNFQAAKFLADRGWDKRAAGRPSKEEKAKLAAQDKRIMDEFALDADRLNVTPLRKG